jgi:hypothetical protein
MLIDLLVGMAVGIAVGAGAVIHYPRYRAPFTVGIAVAAALYAGFSALKLTFCIYEQPFAAASFVLAEPLSCP